MRCKVAMHVLFSAAVIASPLQTTYCPGSDSLILDAKIVHSIVRRMKQTTIIDKSLGTLLHFWAFSNSHITNPFLHPTNNVGLIYPEFFPVSTLYRVKGGRTA